KKEEVEIDDFLRDRLRREAVEELEEEQRLAVEEAEQERERQEQLKAQRQRDFTTQWMQYALRCKPSDAPQEYQLEIRKETTAALAALDPVTTSAVVQQLM